MGSPSRAGKEGQREPPHLSWQSLLRIYTNTPILPSSLVAITMCSFMNRYRQYIAKKRQQMQEKKTGDDGGSSSSSNKEGSSRSTKERRNRRSCGNLLSYIFTAFIGSSLFIAWQRGMFKVQIWWCWYLRPCIYTICINNKKWWQKDAITKSKKGQSNFSKPIVSDMRLACCLFWKTCDWFEIAWEIKIVSMFMVLFCCEALRLPCRVKKRSYLSIYCLTCLCVLLVLNKIQFAVVLIYH